MNVNHKMEDKRQNNAYTHILKYTGLFGGVQALSILVALVRNKLVAILLGPMGMGLMSLFNTTIRFISDSTNLGVGVSAVKHLSEAYEQNDKQKLQQSVQTIRAWATVTALGGMLVCALLSPLLSRYTFGWGKHTLHFLLLSPAVAMTTLTLGETAILKGVRKLGALAHISLINIVLALILTVPLFFFLGISAIVPSINLVALTQLAVTLTFSLHCCPMQFRLDKATLQRGVSMIKLGIAFLFAGIFGSGSDFLIRSFVNNAGSPDTLGLFNAGYMITMTYGGMVFSAMETDYFPRLSAIEQTGATLNATVNKQIEVSLLIISPMLVALIIGLPLILPLLYSRTFSPATAMAQIMALALYLRAVKLPIAYLPLARGDSRSYLLMEGIYAAVYILISIGCFHAFGLFGLGAAVVSVACFDFIMLNVYMRFRYGYMLSRSAVKLMLQQLPIGLVAYVLTKTGESWTYWLAGTGLFCLSLYLSLKELHKRTRLWDKLKAKYFHSSQS